MTDSEHTHEARASSESAAVAGSALVSTATAVGERTRAAARGSWLYRWLTKEPEPDVIVIDLRETRTIGPVLALLIRVIEVLTSYWHASALKRGLDRLVVLGDRAADTHFGEAIARVLEPSVPPAENESDESENTDE